MLRLHEEKDKIGVVYDQIGCPTSTNSLAKACWQIIKMNNEINSKDPQKATILHWSDDGVASWYDLAVAVGDIGIELGIIKKKAFVNPIKTQNYPLPAERPKYSILDLDSTCQILDVVPNH